MGSGSSKPDSQHVFAAGSPVTFSQSVVDSLQNSSETDSVRSRNLELKVQARVQAELEKIRDEEAQRLDSLTAHLTPADDDAPDSSSADPSSLTERISDALTPASLKASDRSHGTVSKEVAELRAKLDKRRRLEQSDPAVDKAKDSLVHCLRMNDRRPLDCWQEVETFKAEVAKLEQKFVDRALR
ncbi:hypothetical protein MBLNU459_g6153t1 [Dothideomycetes sp. NU459]